MRRFNVSLVFTIICSLGTGQVHAQITATLPAILTKTVGLDPAACAPASSIQVAPASTVYYCYLVQNTGDNTYGSHDLVDDQLGQILDSFPFSLTPGATVFLTQSALITATTTNVATWTLSGPGVPPASAADTATVTVAGAPAVLNKTVGLDPASCAPSDSIDVTAGSQVYYCYSLENTSGSAYPLHDLVDDQLGTVFSGLSYNLTPGATVFLTQSALITATTTNVATWTLSGPGLPSASAADTATVNVVLGPPPQLDGILTKTVGLDASVCATGSSVTVPAGSVVAYCYAFQNNSTIPLNYHSLSDDRLGTILSDANLPLAPGGVLTQIVTATINAATVNNATWTASDGPASDPGPTVSAGASASVTLDQNSVLGAPVPTLSEWGILLLGALLLGAGVWVLRREGTRYPKGS